MEFIAIVAKKQNLLLWLQLGVATLIWSEYFLVVMSECPSFLKEKKPTLFPGANLLTCKFPFVAA